MQYVFKAFMMQEWSVTDDTLYVGSKDYPLSEIEGIKNIPSMVPLTNGVMQIALKGGELLTLAYARKQNDSAAEAFKFIKEKLNMKDLVKSGSQYVENKEYKMLCLSCGKTFFYTQKDLEVNKLWAEQARLSSVGSGLNVLGGSLLTASTESMKANQALSQIKDYSKCPYCNSVNIHEMTEQEWNEHKNNTPNTSSPADELKKFKELLDMGAITQEEFDAKKKQLLGL